MIEAVVRDLCGPPPKRREAVDRAEKREMVETLNDIFATSGSVVVARYKGLTVAQMTDLRRRMGGAEAKFKVIKNRPPKLHLTARLTARVRISFLNRRASPTRKTRRRRRKWRPISPRPPTNS